MASQSGGVSLENRKQQNLKDDCLKCQIACAKLAIIVKVALLMTSVDERGKIFRRHGSFVLNHDRRMKKRPDTVSLVT